ncbi:MAG: iron donor protein CyaY [Acidiferrobacterales bacterium]
MNEAEFNRKAEATLLRIEQAVEACGADIDFENSADILTLEFADGSKIIVNKQGAAAQIWVAARSGGYHYAYQTTGNRWVNDQSGAELFSELSRLVSEQASETVTLD